MKDGGGAVSRKVSGLPDIDADGFAGGKPAGSADDEQASPTADIENPFTPLPIVTIQKPLALKAFADEAAPDHVASGSEEGEARDPEGGKPNGEDETGACGDHEIPHDGWGIEAIRGEGHGWGVLRICIGPWAFEVQQCEAASGANMMFNQYSAAGGFARVASS